MNEEVNKQTETENTAQERTLIDADGFKHSVTYDDDGRIVSDKKFDAQGRMRSEDVYENGVQTHCYAYDAGKMFKDTVFEYDKNGRKTAERVFLGKSGEVSRTEFEYNDKNQLVREVEKKGSERKGMDPYFTPSRTQTYQYDDNGVLRHSEVSRSGTAPSTTLIEYDENGRETQERMFDQNNKEKWRTETRYNDAGQLISEERFFIADGKTLSSCRTKAYLYDDNGVLRHAEERDPVMDSADVIDFDENGNKQQHASYINDELKSLEFINDKGSYTFNYDGTRVKRERFVSADKKTVSELYSNVAYTRHTDENGDETDIVYENDNGKLYPSKVNGEPQGKFAPPSWTKRLFGGKEKTAEEVIDKLAYKDEWLLATFADRASGRVSAEDAITALEASVKKYQPAQVKSNEDEIVIAPVNTLEENVIENGEPERTVENVIENGEPEQTVENVIENGEPEQAVENVIENGEPERTVENVIENGEPERTVENVIENGEPEQAVENVIENGEPKQTAENVIVNTAPKQTAESVVANTAPKQTAESVVANTAPEQTAENSDNQSDQTSENEDEEVYVAENGNEDEKAKGLGEEDLMKQGKNLQQWINYFGMEGSRAKPPYASPFESIKECRNLKGSALMDLENGNTLINSTNRMELVVRSKEGEKKEPTLEECMTLVRLGQQKGWTSIRITGSPAFQKQMYLACRSLGMPTKDFVPTPEMLKEGAELENAFNSKDKTLPQSAEDTEARNPEMREPTLSERCADLDSRFFALEKIREIQPPRKKTKEDPHPELANFDTIRAAEKEGIRPLTAVEKEPDDLDGKLRVLNKRSKEALEDLKQTEKNRKKTLLNEMGADQRNEWRNRLTAVQQKEDSGQPLSAEDNRIKAMADKYQINVDPTKEPETRRRIDLEDFDQKNKKAFRKKESMIERTSAFETAVVRREAALNASAMISSESAKLPSKKDLLATARKEWKQVASAHQPVSETLRQIGNINAETATLTERNKKNYNKVTKRNGKNNQQASEASEQRNAFVRAAAQNSR